jgi:hypothetical protein
LEDYIKSVDLLTVQNDKSKLEKQVKELKEKSKDSEYIINGKLHEKYPLAIFQNEQYELQV